MAMEQVGQGSWTDSFHQYQAEIMEKIKKGETEESIPTGASAFTKTQWEKVLKSVDRQIDDIREEQKARFEKEEERAEAVRIYEAASSRGNPLENLYGGLEVPYGYLAKDGMIAYNDVTFVCDPLTNSICLGDVSDEANTLIIPLAEGGCLKVNRNNLDELQKAIGMFSPEDINRIMRAIAKDNKAREMQQELEEEASDVTGLQAGAASKENTPEAEKKP